MTGGAHELVLASAGSGKTFRISSRILVLLASGVEPDRLFASTFTRKAAGEVLARVLERLSDAAHSAEGAATLGKQLDELVEEERFADLTRDDWRGILARTMRSLHRFDVSTLDAFFSRAVRAFGHELGLPAGWRIADEATAERLRSRALEDVLSSVDTAAMVELVRGMRGGETHRSVHEGVGRDVDAIVGIHRDLDPAGPGWDALGAGLGIADDGAAGDGDGGASAGDPGTHDARADHLVEELNGIPLPTTKAGTPRKNWLKARDRIAAALASADWEAVVDETLVQRAGDAMAEYDGVGIDGEFRRVLREIRELARQTLGRIYHARARAMARLGEGYDGILDTTLREAGALRFEDVTRLLAGPASPGGRDDLEYRLDSGIRHLLLDEFQDTSLLQWKALRPLTDRLLGGTRPGTSSSVVADPKQSIYGWRGAAPVIVDALEETYGPERATLSKSWRSSLTVLQAVNRVFSDIADNPVLADEPVDRETARGWAAHFQAHTAAREGLPGHVTLEAGPARQGRGDLQPALIRFVAARVAALHRADPGRSIGILMRKNESVGRMIYELKALGVEASEEGGTRLADAPAVVSVLALLRMADHPGNGLARYHVARTPVGRAVGYTDPGDEAGARRVSLRLRERLVRDGYGVTLSRLRDALRPSCGPRDLDRLGQLVELGHAHDELASLRVDDFVTVAEAARVESPGQAPIRVMTVWGAKGLEFDAVFLPDLHLSMTGGGFGSPPLAFRPTPTAPVHSAFPPMRSAIRELFAPSVPELDRAWGQQRAAEVRDALSGLYVAMTRARYALHMIIPAEPKKPSGSRSPARLLRHALDPQPSATTEEGQPPLYQEGNPEWWKTAPGKGDSGPATHPAGPDAPRRIRLAPRAHRRLLERRAPSDHEVDLDQLLGLAGRDAAGIPATLRGSVVHGWMEAVTWLEDGLPDPATRLALARREAPEYGAGGTADSFRAWLDELWSWVAARLEMPEIREALTRETVLADMAADLGDPRTGADPAVPPSEPLTLQVENELPFLHREGDTLMEGIIDRLVLVRAAPGKPGDAEGWEDTRVEGEAAEAPVVAAHILDYKTDALPAGDEAALKARADLYAPQLRAYRRAVSALYGLPADRVRLTLLFLEPGRAVAIP